MRLLDWEKKHIVEIAKQVFGEITKVILFGSRVDDAQRGGDIDLFLEIAKQEDVYSKKSKYRIFLEDAIGEQKIDIITSQDNNKLMESEVVKYGEEIILK